MNEMKKVSHLIKLIKKRIIKSDSKTIGKDENEYIPYKTSLNPSLF